MRNILNYNAIIPLEIKNFKIVRKNVWNLDAQLDMDHVFRACLHFQNFTKCKQVT